MEHDKREHEETPAEYVQPQVRDYGELRDLTASHIRGNTTDVAFGTTSPEHAVFSLP